MAKYFILNDSTTVSQEPLVDTRVETKETFNFFAKLYFHKNIIYLFRNRFHKI